MLTSSSWQKDLKTPYLSEAASTSWSTLSGDTDSLRCLKPEGRLLVIGFTSGDIPEVKVNRLLLNNISVVGVGWGAYEMARPGTMRVQYESMLPHLADGSLAPVAGPSFDLADAAAALGALDRREATGKITLRV